MAEIRKHIGIIKNTGTRVVVVFREIPEDVENCLVVEIDRLPEKYYDKMQEFLIQTTAKQTNDFYTFLNKATFPDGTNALQSLHTNRLLRKIDVDSIVMTPLPHQELPLRVLNDQINGVEEKSSDTAPPVVDPVAPSQDYSAMSEQEVENIARGLMAQSEILKFDADAKEQEARKLAPHLFKKKRGRPKKSETQKEASEKKSKENRNKKERDQRKQAKEDKIDDAVMEKIQRDIERKKSQ